MARSRRKPWCPSFFRHLNPFHAEGFPTRRSAERSKLHCRAKEKSKVPLLQFAAVARTAARAAAAAAAAAAAVPPSPPTRTTPAENR
ncbi:hypothetical protein PG988_003489 [Apiospora saccharicola]